MRPPDSNTVRTPAPAAGSLVDTFGRVADDLRVSVTDRCNFRCTYCMPADGLKWLPREELLTFEELTRLLAVFISLGVRSVKITGGEPTVRAQLPGLIRMFRRAGPDLDISMTTNGLLLDRLATPLAEAGLDRVTVSCDSLMRHRFAETTRRDALDRVLGGIRAAQAAGLAPLKINCVVVGGNNEDEVVGFARWARETGYPVRFIEYMPLDAEHMWERAKVIPSASVIEVVDRAYPLVALARDDEPATRFVFADGAPGEIGVISPVTAPFCDACNRIRLTAEGQVSACLFALEETDLRTPLRSGATDDPCKPVAQVVRSPDQPSGLRSPQAQHVDDRRLNRHTDSAPHSRFRPQGTSESPDDDTGDLEVPSRRAADAPEPMGTKDAANGSGAVGAHLDQEPTALADPLA
jgi:cyclic pyranopterin phosphate synthase